MIEDFAIAIGQAWLVKQEMMELDKRKIWPYHLPEIAATESQILIAERHLHHPLDQRYKAFLKCANGWKAFYQTVDLFGTEDLISGPQKECGEFHLSYLNEEVIKKSGFCRGDLLPIAGTKLDRDLFAITRPHSSKPGVVVWFAGEEIDRFPNFDEYFLAMLEYNRKELKVFLEQG